MIRGLIFFTAWMGVFLLMWTQIIHPLMRSTPIFPIIRRRGQLDRDLAEAREESDLVEKEVELARLKQEAAGQRREGAESEDAESKAR